MLSKTELIGLLQSKVEYTISDDENDIIIKNRNGINVPIRCDSKGIVTMIGDKSVDIQKVKIEDDGVMFICKNMSYKVRL